VVDAATNERMYQNDQLQAFQTQIPVHVGFMVEKVFLGCVYLPVLQFCDPANSMSRNFCQILAFMHQGYSREL
jgi:hypothetical protein